MPDIGANELIEQQLHEQIGDLQNLLEADVLTFMSRIRFGADDVVRGAIESFADRRPRLAVILQTNGGFIEVVNRMVDTMRRHYDHVEYIIPNYALSAGTVLVMSGDAIHMDYYSVLGPIDPQLERPTGEFVPAVGYLVQYERLIDKSRRGELTLAEATILVEKFDLAELYQYEQARELSITLLKDWLVRYKFKNWKKTEGRGKKVTLAMWRRRAGEVAKKLNDPSRWHSHGRGISMEVLRRDLKLKIEDFGQNAALRTGIGDYYYLMMDYRAKMGHTGVVHTKGRYIPLVG